MSNRPTNKFQRTLLDSARELIAEIQRNRPQSTPAEESARSYRNDCIGSDERPCRRFLILSAPSDVVIIKKNLPAPGSSEDWHSHHIYGEPSCTRPRIRREISDRNWPAGKSSPWPVKPHQGWHPFTVHEGLTFEELLAQGQAKADHEKHDTYRDPAKRKRVSLDSSFPEILDHGERRSITALDLEDTGPIPSSPATKRFDPSAFCRKELRKLFLSKTSGEVDAIAEVLAWQAKGLSVREIAKEMERTQGWVRHRLDVVSKIYFSNEVNALAAT